MDIFTGDAFSMRTMTDAVNKLPFKPAQLGALGIFRESGIATTRAMCEERNGVLYLVPNTPRGGPAIQNRAEGRKLIPLETVHLPVEDRVSAAEIQDVRAFGQESMLKSVQGEVSDRQRTMVQSLEATLEHLRIGAIKGIQYDANGTTVLNNFFTIFGITEQDVVHFNFADITTANYTDGAIRRLCSNIIRRIEDALGATPYDYVHAMVGKDFMDRLIDNPETRDAYHRWQEGAALRGSFVRGLFAFSGITFEEYRGSVGERQFIADNEARFFPVGAPDIFRISYAPADFFSEVNTRGRPLFSKVVPDAADRWADIFVESNPLVYCARPRVLIRGLVAS